ncbi:MAG: hydrogenase iron-sulfur subunit [Desulfobacterales bacterium]|jgi:hypothetical protein|nr:hydrogenase iron-sulfur subunit [Desulfobacterales bacterium]
MVTACFIQEILNCLQINSDRLLLDWASAAEAPLYVELITTFTNRIKELGPLGHVEGIELNDLQSKLSAAGRAVKSIKMRTRFAKLTRYFRESKDYSKSVIQAKIVEKLRGPICQEIEKQEVAVRRMDN